MLQDLSKQARSWVHRLNKYFVQCWSRFIFSSKFSIVEKFNFIDNLKNLLFWTVLICLTGCCAPSPFPFPLVCGPWSEIGVTFRGSSIACSSRGSLNDEFRDDSMFRGVGFRARHGRTLSCHKTNTIQDFCLFKYFESHLSSRGLSRSFRSRSLGGEASRVRFRLSS